MSTALIDDPPVTIASFDAFLASQRDPRLWELVEGRIIAMAEPTLRHGQIVANLGAPLKLAMDRVNCRTYFGGIRIQRSDDLRGLNKPRPDLLVVGTEISNRSYVKEPLVVVEVLAQSTLDLNRGEKLRFYKSLPTLVHLVLVYQDQMRVEHYAKRDTGWKLETATTATDHLGLESIGFEIALKTVYFGVSPGA